MRSLLARFCAASGEIADTDRASSERWQTFLGNLARPRRSSQNEPFDAERRLRRANEVARAAGFVRDPLVLAIDGLQYWDEISIELLSHLVRFLGERDAKDRPPILVVVGYREEGPSVALLREISEYLLTDGKAEVITLKPLGVRDTLSLHRRSVGAAGVPRHLGLYQHTGGSPARIIGASAGTSSSSKDAARTTSKAISQTATDLQSEERHLLFTLVLLGRPCETGEICGLTAFARTRVRSLLAALACRDLIDEVEIGLEALGWTPGAGASDLLAEISASDRKRRHRAIG